MPIVSRLIDPDIAWKKHARFPYTKNLTCGDLHLWPSLTEPSFLRTGGSPGMCSDCRLWAWAVHTSSLPPQYLLHLKNTPCPLMCWFAQENLTITKEICLLGLAYLVRRFRVEDCGYYKELPFLTLVCEHMSLIKWVKPNFYKFG